MRILNVIILLLFSSILLGQRGEVVYEVTKNLRGIPLTQNAHLFFDGNESIFYTNRGDGVTVVDRYGNVGGMDMQVTTTNTNDGKADLDFIYRDSLGHTVYTDFSTNEVVVRDIFFLDPIVYKEPSMPKIEWTFTKETKAISGLDCRKAIGNFRGRSYEVWFTFKVPLKFAPWKFYGLPGMIVEVKDSRNEIEYRLLSYNIGNDVKVPPIKSKVLAPVIPFENVKKTVETIQNKYYRMFKAQSGRNTDVAKTKINYIEQF